MYYFKYTMSVGCYVISYLPPHSDPPEWCAGSETNYYLGDSDYSKCVWLFSKNYQVLQLATFQGNYNTKSHKVFITHTTEYWSGRGGVKFVIFTMTAICNASLPCPIYFYQTNLTSPDSATTLNTPCQLVAMPLVTYYHIQIAQNASHALKLMII